MNFKKTKRFETHKFESFKNLHQIAHLARAKDGTYIQIFKDELSGDIILNKNNDFYKISSQDLTCLETIYYFFGVNPEDVLLSSCISTKPKRIYKTTQILNWNWKKIHEKLDLVKMQFLHYN
jgi:hypothetical protein